MTYEHDSTPVLHISTESRGVSFIARERWEQLYVHEWSAISDAVHDEGELLMSAACYLDHALVRTTGEYALATYKWPWDESWWKPSDDPVKDLTKAGALIAAEIDRLLLLRGSPGT